MDIFSTANKQVQSSQPNMATDPTSMSRSVKGTQEAPTKANEQNAEQIKQKLTETVDKLNNNMETLDTNVKFGFNEKISTMFVDVIERSSGKIIRKIPTEEAMLLSEKMQEIIGTIFDEKG